MTPKETKYIPLLYEVWRPQILIYSQFQRHPNFSTMRPGMLGCYGVKLGCCWNWLKIRIWGLQTSYNNGMDLDFFGKLIRALLPPSSLCPSLQKHASSVRRIPAFEKETFCGVSPLPPSQVKRSPGDRLTNCVGIYLHSENITVQRCTTS